MNMHKRIEICGGIASGKTTLAKLLVENNIGVGVYENFQKNPFWEAFYTEPNKYIFETEVTFTLQHYHEIKKNLKHKSLVCDYALIQDVAYAKIGLHGTKLNIYKDIVNELFEDINKCDYLIYLKCSSKEELKRIRDRARAVEQNINIDFLSLLNNSIYQALEEETDMKILEIDSEKYNFANSIEDKNIILEKIINFIKFQA